MLRMKIYRSPLMYNCSLFINVSCGLLLFFFWKPINTVYFQVLFQAWINHSVMNPSAVPINLLVVVLNRSTYVLMKWLRVLLSSFTIIYQQQKKPKRGKEKQYSYSYLEHIHIFFS